VRPKRLSSLLVNDDPDEYLVEGIPAAGFGGRRHAVHVLWLPDHAGRQFRPRPRIRRSLSGTGTSAQGVVLCNQPRILDLQRRGAAFVEKVPAAIIDEVIAKLLTLLE
jgi:hypothetical protein